MRTPNSKQPTNIKRVVLLSVCDMIKVPIIIWRAPCSIENQTKIRKKQKSKMFVPFLGFILINYRLDWKRNIAESKLSMNKYYRVLQMIPLISNRTLYKYIRTKAFGCVYQQCISYKFIDQVVPANDVL